MRDSGGLRSAALPARNPLLCVRLSLHELKRTTVGCERVLNLKRDVIFRCQIKFGYKMLWLHSLFNNNVSIFKCVCICVGECLCDVRWV